MSELKRCKEKTQSKKRKVARRGTASIGGQIFAPFLGLKTLNLTKLEIFWSKSALETPPNLGPTDVFSKTLTYDCSSALNDGDFGG